MWAILCVPKDFGCPHRDSWSLEERRWLQKLFDETLGWGKFQQGSFDDILMIWLWTMQRYLCFKNWDILNSMKNHPFVVVQTCRSFIGHVGFSCLRSLCFSFLGDSVLSSFPSLGSTFPKIMVLCNQSVKNVLIPKIIIDPQNLR